MVDELALEFSEGELLVDQFLADGWISDAVATRAHQLEKRLEGLSTEYGTWNIASLRLDSRWNEVREAAQDLLILIG